MCRHLRPRLSSWKKGEIKKLNSLYLYLDLYLFSHLFFPVLHHSVVKKEFWHLLLNRPLIVEGVRQIHQRSYIENYTFRCHQSVLSWGIRRRSETDTSKYARFHWLQQTWFHVWVFAGRLGGSDRTCLIGDTAAETLAMFDELCTIIARSLKQSLILVKFSELVIWCLTGDEPLKIPFLYAWIAFWTSKWSDLKQRGQ